MDLLEKTKKVAHRMTPLREKMVEIFKNSGIPLSAHDILSYVEMSGLKPNRTTIYREIGFFLRNKLISEVQLNDSKQRYEKVSESCTHHLVCKNCGKITYFCLGDKIHLIEKSILKETGFNVDRHVVEFYGLCRLCTKTKAANQ